MGWDAYATSEMNKDGLLERDEKTNSGSVFQSQLVIKDQVYARAFKQARNNVLEHSQYVDGLLELGGLDCSNCAHVLEKLTGINAWGDRLSAEEVQALVVSEYEPAPADKWAYLSALEFLRTCKEHKLGIRFSW